MHYHKGPTTYIDQLTILKGRGLGIPDEESATQTLKLIGYYRLSSYALPFQDKKDVFKEGTTFQDLLDLYNFDHKLRVLIFDAIETIEIAIRSQITYYLSHKYGAFGYAKRENFNKAFSFDLYHESFQKEKQKAHELFIEHFNEKYSEENYLPIWMLTETLSFGTLSNLFKGLLLQDQKAIAREFKLQQDVLGSWLHTLTYIRNICAHHSRLWNRQLQVFPKLPHRWPDFQNNEKRRVFIIFTLLHYCIDTIEAVDHKLGNEFNLKKQLKSLIAQKPDVPLGAMGFPDNWEELDLWKD